MWKSTSNEPISLESMTFEEMETAVAFKARGEACNIAGESQLEYDNLKAQYLSAINESERVGVLQAMKNLLHTAVLQNLAANALKSFGTFTDTSTELAMCLLDFRKLFTTDQSKVQPIQNRINRAIARAALPRIQDDAKPSAKSSDDAKLSEEPVPAQASAKNANPDRAPSGRLRKKITQVQVHLRILLPHLKWCIQERVATPTQSRIICLMDFLPLLLSGLYQLLLLSPNPRRTFSLFPLKLIIEFQRRRRLRSLRSPNPRRHEFLAKRIRSIKPKSLEDFPLPQLVLHLLRNLVLILRTTFRLLLLLTRY